MRRKSTWSWSRALLAWLGAMLRLALAVGVPFLVTGYFSGQLESAYVGFTLGYVFFGSLLTAIFLFAILPTSWLGGVLAAAAAVWFFVEIDASVASTIVFAAWAGFMGLFMDSLASQLGPVKAMSSWSVSSSVR